MSLIPWRNKQRKRDLPATRAESPLDPIRMEIDRIFDRVSRGWGGVWDEPFFGTEGWAPSVDISESEKDVTIKAELPGVDPNELNVSISGDLLTLSGEKKESRETKEKSVHRSECYIGTFQRSIRLPVSVDPEKVSAEYANGVLTVTFKKSNVEKPKRIAVKDKEL